MNILKTTKIKEYRDREKRKSKGKCPLFEIDLDTSTVSRSCLDHDHNIPCKGCSNLECGRVRGTLSSVSNLLLGRIEKIWNKYGKKHTHITLSQFLQNCVRYLDQDFSMNPVHPKEVELWRKRVLRWRINTIKSKLEDNGIDHKGITLKKDLAKLYVDKVIMPTYFKED